MSDDFLADRKKALEESFFAKENARLVERLKAKKDKSVARDGLRRISGVKDTELLDKLVELEIGPDTWAAVSLLPLVEVAWADGQMEEKERRAILSSAEADGVAAGTPSFDLLQGWLERRPDARLIEVWGEYIVGVCAHLGASERAAFKREILGRARAIAEAAGGLLGMGNKISDHEANVLTELEKAFAG
jgi:hypothetical protein